MKPHITAITVQTHVMPTITDTPFISVFFGRGEQSNPTHFHPTPSSLRRVMRWQAATLIAARKAEAQS